MRSSTLCLALPLLALAAPAAAQTLRGRVLDAASGEPVAQVAVAARDSAGHDVGHTRTGADGGFSMPLRAAGTFHLQAQRTGYAPATTQAIPVDPRETVTVEVKLSATAVAIAPLTVTARTAPSHRRTLELAGFYDRERWGMGKYLRREDFEQHSTDRLAEVLARAPGTIMFDHGPYQYIAFTRSAATVSLRYTVNNQCLPKLYLDGNLTAYGKGLDINAIVSPEQVEGVELYRSTAELPPQYGGSDASCGVILVWTRHEP